MPRQWQIDMEVATHGKRSPLHGKQSSHIEPGKGARAQKATRGLPSAMRRKRQDAKAAPVDHRTTTTGAASTATDRSVMSEADMQALASSLADRMNKVGSYFNQAQHIIDSATKANEKRKKEAERQKEEPERTWGRQPGERGEETHRLFQFPVDDREGIIHRVFRGLRDKEALEPREEYRLDIEPRETRTLTPREGYRLDEAPRDRGAASIRDFYRGIQDKKGLPEYSASIDPIYPGYEPRVPGQTTYDSSVPTKAIPETNAEYLHHREGSPYYNEYNPFSLWDREHNCTHHAYGRALELGADPEALNTLQGDAWMWEGNAGRGAHVERTPEVGAIASYDRHHPIMAPSGRGHVGVVEKVFDDGSILMSDTGWSSQNYNLRDLSPGDPLYPDAFIHVPRSGR